MVYETKDGNFLQTNLPNESADYRRKREELRVAEVELMQQRERVAALRRQLPEGATVPDYVFEEGPASLDAADGHTRPVRLSELLTAPERSLVIYHLMYGKKQKTPCPMCTAWIDGVNGIVKHLAQTIDFAVVAAADTVALRAHARARGWNQVRLLSAGSSTFKYDLGSESPDGGQDSMISVFSRGNDVSVRHFYSAHPRMSKEIKERGIDLLTPIWNFLDLTPRGRGDFYAKLEYPAKAKA